MQSRSIAGHKQALWLLALWTADERMGWAVSRSYCSVRTMKDWAGAQTLYVILTFSRAP